MREAWAHHDPSQCMPSPSQVSQQPQQQPRPRTKRCHSATSGRCWQQGQSWHIQERWLMGAFLRLAGVCMACASTWTAAVCCAALHTETTERGCHFCACAHHTCRAMHAAEAASSELLGVADPEPYLDVDIRSVCSCHFFPHAIRHSLLLHQLKHEQAA